VMFSVETDSEGEGGRGRCSSWPWKRVIGVSVLVVAVAFDSEVTTGEVWNRNVGGRESSIEFSLCRRRIVSGGTAVSSTAGFDASDVVVEAVSSVSDRISE